MDASRVKIEVLPNNGETIASVMVKTAKEQSDLLREKYKKFKNDTK